MVPIFLPSRFFTSATGIVVSLQGQLGLANKNIAAGGARNSAAHEQQVIFRIDSHHAQILGGLALMPHVPWEMLAGPHARGKRTRSDTAGRAMEHGAVRRIAAAE